MTIVGQTNLVVLTDEHSNCLAAKAGTNTGTFEHDLHRMEGDVVVSWM